MLIESENLLARIDKCYQESAKTGLGMEPVMAIRDIKALISVMPIVHEKGTAYWIHETDRVNHWHCSNCNQVWGIVHRFMNYCPNCGALMAGEKDDPT